MMPGRHIPKVRIPHFDKVVHVSLYLIFAVLTYWGWMMQDHYMTLHHRTLIKVFILLSAYGYLIEIMQGTLTADRSYDIYDALANACGALVGAWAAQFFWQRTKT